MRTKGATKDWHGEGGGAGRRGEGEPMRRGGSKADVWEEDGGRASRETELGGALCEHMGNNGANSRIGAEVLGQQELGLRGFGWGL